MTSLRTGRFYLKLAAEVAGLAEPLLAALAHPPRGGNEAPVCGLGKELAGMSDNRDSANKVSTARIACAVESSPY